MNKQAWLNAAEVFDSWRVVPRLLVFMYAYFVYHTTEMILVWYFNTDLNGRGTQESSVVIAVITAVTGYAGWILKIYTDAGRTWGTAGSSSSSSVSTTETKVTS